MASPADTSLVSVNELLTPMRQLIHAVTPPLPSSSSSVVSHRSIPLSELPGVPIMIYRITDDALQVTKIQLAEK